ncbi:MAG: hypothetical protein NWE98_02070 [Candidatus Bathyarchaeota archaeon]|nr:hypothetical protein [Candidatus Bathyarchaeota archaeon]
MTNHVTATVPNDVFAAIEKLRGNKSRNLYIREIICSFPEIAEYVKNQPKIS